MRSTRRHTLVALVVVGLIAAACGDDDEATSSNQPPSGAETTTATGGASTSATTGASVATGASATSDTRPAPSDVDPDGVLKVGADLTAGSGIYFDLTVPVSTPATWHYMINDTLLRAGPDGSLGPGLAKSATVVDPTTLTVELQPNVKFSDGTPMDAEAVKSSIERNIALAQQGSFEAELYQLDAITVDSPTALTIKLKSPVGGAWYRLLSLQETAPVSPTAVAQRGAEFNTNPVGAGPFVLDSFTPQLSIKLTKNPTYFQADEIRLAGVEFVHTTAPSLATSLRSGAVDVPDSVVSYNQAKELTGANLDVASNVTGNAYFHGHWCKSRPPFDDVRVRQALNYAVNRDALNQTLYEGKGQAMWGFFPAASPLHDKSLDNYYPYDTDKAKALLAEAGQSELTFEALFTPGTESQVGAEVIQQQYAEVGVTMTLKPLTNVNDFYPDGKAGPLLWMTLQRSGLNKVTRVYAPGSYGNICSWNDPELNAPIDQLRTVPEASPQAIPFWAQIEEQALESGVTVFGLFAPQNTAYNPDRIGDAEFVPNNLGRPVINFHKAYIKN